MKVGGPGPLGGPAPRRPLRAASEAGSGFRLAAAAGEEAATQRAGATSGASPVAALLALQEVPDATRRPSRGVRRGRDLLDELDAVRLALLTGRLPRARLERLAQAVRERAGEESDPRLAEALAEIELRAAVELAKLELLEQAGAA